MRLLPWKLLLQQLTSKLTQKLQNLMVALPFCNMYKP
jgi:hypothetical protein